MEKMREYMSLIEDMGRLDTNAAKDWTEEEFPSCLIRERLPKHVGVMMDGNRRWAKKHGLESVFSPDGSFGKVLLLVQLCCKLGIKILTVFIFSAENWVRPKHEVDFYMKVIELAFSRSREFYMRYNVRVSFIGDTLKVPISLHKLLTEITEATKNHTRLHFIVGLSYGGRQDIIRACTSISRKAKDGLIEPEDIDENLIDQELDTKCTEFPSPDLIIRTSGEKRISNFLMWQSAYSELHFEDCLWPDFGEKELINALRSFQERRRRFGGSDEEGIGEECYKQAMELMDEYASELSTSTSSN